MTTKIYEKFCGIREKNGVNTGGQISAIKAENVELFQTEIGSGVGVKSTDGNTPLYTLPTGYTVKGVFESKQDGTSYLFIYGETTSKGTLFYINASNQVTSLIDDLTVTGKCNGITMSANAYDVFVFTNGEEAKTVCFTSDTSYGSQVKTITATDYLNRSIKWLSMTEWNGFLVVASQYGIHSSHQNDIYTFNDNPTDVADSWYIDFSKPTTAVVSFSNGLYIFTGDDVSFLNTTPNDTANSYMQNAGMNGCLNFQSVIKHDTYLFFYDDRQKNIYYIEITNVGQTRPSGPVAKEVQSYFADVDSFKMFSCIYENKNRIWCLVNGKILIYDYFLGEWTLRNSQSIETICLFKNTLCSASGCKVLVENINNNFDGVFYPSVYQTTFINFGSNSNLKKQSTPLLLVVNDEYVNNFWIELICDFNAKNARKILVSNASDAVFGDDSTEAVTIETETFDSAHFSAENNSSKKIVKITAPQNWYTLGIKIYTKTLGEGFCINSLELKDVAIKTDRVR